MRGTLRRPAHWAYTAVAGLMLAAAGLVFAPDAQALPMSSCTTTKNVVVAVSFQHWNNGPVVRGCGPAGGTGLDVMHAAGFQTTGTQHDGPAFVCRIGSASFRGGAGYPTAAEDNCVNTPPASAYWSYWHADPGQNSWTYSKLGAASYHPQPGSVDYWQFGSTSTSGGTSHFDVSPNEVRAQNASSGGGGGSAGQGSGSGGRPGSTHGGAAARTPAHHDAAKDPVAPSQLPVHITSTSASPGQARSSGGAKSSAASRSGATSSPGPGASPKAGDSAARIVDGSPAANSSTPSSSGSAVPLVIGLVAVLLIGGGAGWVMVRRRSAAG